MNTLKLSMLSLLALALPQAAHAVEVDTDGDGFPNVVEQILGTSPTLADTDGDGVSDSREWFSRTHPLNPNSHPNLNNLPKGLRAFAWQTAVGSPVQIHVVASSGPLLQTLRVYFVSGKNPTQLPQLITPPRGPPTIAPDGTASVTFTLATLPADSLKSFSPIGLGFVAGDFQQNTIVTDRIGLVNMPGRFGIALLENLTGPPGNTRAVASLDPNSNAPHPPGGGPGTGGSGNEEARYCLITLDGG